MGHALGCAGRGDPAAWRPAGRNGPPDKPIWFNSPHLFLAPDDEHWALLGTTRLAIGRREKTLAVRWWTNGSVEKKGTWDLERGRFWWACGIHVGAVDLEGRVVASWDGNHPDAIERVFYRAGVVGKEPTPERALPGGGRFEAMLLAGVGLDRVRGLVQRHVGGHKALRRCQVELPVRGPAIRRYTPQRRPLKPPRGRTPAARTCAAGLVELADLGDGMGLYASACSACDEVTTGSYVFDLDGPVTRGAGADCPGEPRPGEPMGLEGGAAGGPPPWLQGAAPPSCPDCKRMLHFVGWGDAGALHSGMPDIRLYAFRCLDCDVAVQEMQRT